MCPKIHTEKKEYESPEEVQVLKILISTGDSYFKIQSLKVGINRQPHCASYMLSKKYGMDISQFDFTHAPEFFENMEPQEVRGELSKARDAANTISGRMTRVLEQDKNLNRRQQEKSEVEQKESEDKTGEQKTQEHDRGEAR